MEAVIDSIRIAMSDGASDDERRRGLAACAAVADALEGALVTAPSAPAAVPTRPIAVTPEIVSSAELTTLDPPVSSPRPSNPFAGMGADEILELAIAKLRGAVGETEAPPAPAGLPFRLTLVPVPRIS